MPYIANYNLIHGDIYKIKCPDLQPNRKMRKYYCPEAMDSLVKSIKSCGQIHPITFTRIGDRFEIVSGYRRWVAFQIAGIECIQAKYVDRDLEAIALAENFQREDLTPLEKAELILLLKTQHNATLSQISEYIGKSKSSVSELLSLNYLPEDIKFACRNSNKYVLTRLVQIAKTPGLKAKRQLFKRYQLELSGERYRREPRSDQNAISKLFTQLDRLKTDLLKVKTDQMSDKDISLLCDKINTIEQISDTMFNRYG